MRCCCCLLHHRRRRRRRRHCRRRRHRLRRRRCCCADAASADPSAKEGESSPRRSLRLWGPSRRRGRFLDRQPGKTDGMAPTVLHGRDRAERGLRRKWSWKARRKDTVGKCDAADAAADAATAAAGEDDAGGGGLGGESRDARGRAARVGRGRPRGAGVVSVCVEAMRGLRRAPSALAGAAPSGLAWAGSRNRDDSLLLTFALYFSDNFQIH
ncbi:uncharacterized protein LOC144455964 [Phascolarctos cinereus]